MIFEGSRYEDAQVIRVADASGDVWPTVYPYPYFDEQHFQFERYTVRQGDRYDIIAAQVYGDPELWWILARANPEVFYPEDLPYGSVIRVPDASSVL